MMNAKTEFLLECKGKTLICAELTFGRDYRPDDQNTFYLKKGYTSEQYKKFLSDIDQQYDDGYGSQELYGLIWFKNGIWSERHEYDGFECWVGKQYPKIPKELL